MTTTKTRFVFVAAAAALSLSLAACSGDSGDEGTTDTGGGEETSAAEATDEAEETAEETTEAAASGGAECLVGSWEITPEAAEEQILAAYGGEGEAEVSGTSTIEFDGTVYTAVSDTEASFDVEFQGTPLEGTTASDGTLEIEYTADDTTVTFGEVVAADGTVVTTVGGQDLEIDFAETAGALSGQTQDYVCDGDELTVTTTLAGAEEELELEQIYTRTS